jgi:hypothetical protein
MTPATLRRLLAPSQERFPGLFEPTAGAARRP